jgi:hypothetical protein
MGLNSWGMTVTICLHLVLRFYASTPPVCFHATYCNIFTNHFSILILKAATSCSVTHFSGTCHFHLLSRLKIKTASSTTMLVTNFPTTRHYIPEEATFTVTNVRTSNLNFTPVQWSAKPEYVTFGLITKTKKKKKALTLVLCK